MAYMIWWRWKRDTPVAFLHAFEHPSRYDWHKWHRLNRCGHGISLMWSLAINTGSILTKQLTESQSQRGEESHQYLI
jgi:hypothetical protein